MTESARQPYSWAEWNKDVNAKIARLQKKVDLLENSYYGSIEDHNAGKPPAIVRLILNTVLNLANERKFMRDVGIWSAECLYGPGSTVTSAGCLWICQTQNTGMKPGESSVWRLAQKSVDVELKKEIRSMIRDEIRRQCVEKRESAR
jgi:hypothetical protein